MRMELVRTPRRTKRRVWMSAAIGVVILGLLACVGLSVYVGWQLTHKPREPITVTPKDYGMAYERATFTSKDGKTALEGWIIPPKGAAKMTVSFCPWVCRQPDSEKRAVFAARQAAC